MTTQAIISATTAHWLRSDEEPQWEDFVGNHPLGLIYHRTSWKQVLEQAFPHIRGRFLVLRDADTGTIQAGMPVYTVKSWLLGNRVVSIPFASFCDPLISSIEEFQQLAPHLQDICRESSGRRLELRTRKTAGYLAALSMPSASNYKHHFLPLDRQPEALFNSFSKTAIRQSVVKAGKSGVTVIEADNREGVKTCYDILLQTRRRLCLPPMPLSFFTAMQSYLWPKQMRMFLALHHGKPVGCLLALIERDLWIAEYSGNSDDAVAGVNQLLYWETIQRACAAGAKMFSFGRTALSNQGLLTYKQRWATVEEDLVDFVLSSEASSLDSKPQRESHQNSRSYRVLRPILSKAPAPVCRMIGKFCYRHLG